MIVRKKQQKFKVKDLFDKLGFPNSEKVEKLILFNLRVKTPYGYYPIRSIFSTEIQEYKIRTYFSNGKTLATSEHHLLKREDGEWVKVKDLQVGDFIIHEKGKTKITKFVKRKFNSFLYDMSVEDVHCYYSNSILSHNSWTAIASAGHAARNGFNVIYYSLELAESYVGKRFDSYFTGIPFEIIEKNKEVVRRELEKLGGSLIVKEYPPKQASISTIKSHVQKCSNMGFTPDLIVIDYADYLKPPHKNKYSERKDEIDDVFIGAKALAKELGIPVITPSQVNRQGAKDDVIEADKVAGSYDKIMVSDICLSLSRKKEDKVDGTARIHILKNRHGKDGITFNTSFDASTGHIEFLDEVPFVKGDGPVILGREYTEKIFKNNIKQD